MDQDRVSELKAVEVDLPVIIRPAAAQDLPHQEWDREMWAFRELFQQAFQDSQRERRLMLVAEVERRLVGRLFVQLAGGNLFYADGSTRAYLYSLHVVAPFQGRGIGTRLIQIAEQMVLDRGFQWTTIAVAVNNVRARSLYERLGYVVFRRDDSHWSYTDPDGFEHEVREVCWALKKRLMSRKS